MKHRLCAFFAGFLALLLLSALCPFAAFAARYGEAGEPSSNDAETPRRFLFDTLTDAAGKPVTVRQESPLSLSLASGRAVFRAESPEVPTANEPTNSLYLALVNGSSATGVRISYRYAGYAPDVETIEQALAPHSSEMQYFLLDAPHIEEDITDFTLTFTGASAPEGEVVLHSLYNFSTYRAPEQSGAVIETCRYDAETDRVEIAGTLDYAATVRYAGDTLALFALGPSESLYLSGKTPIARTGISFTFSFSLPVEHAEDYLYRYVLAAVTRSGERVPLSTPFAPGSAWAAPAGEVGFKGFHTASISRVLDSGAGIEIVDVYLDRLFGGQENGILYAGDHAYYYFDEAYVADLDLRIRSLTSVDCAVYLRFLVSPDANGLPFAVYTDTAGEIVNKGIAIQNEEAMRMVTAATDFLTLRYGKNTLYRLDGIVVGRRVDRQGKWNYAGSVGLERYSELYAAAFSIIGAVALHNLPGVQLVLPLSDRVIPEACTAHDLNDDFPAILFLRSFLEALRDRVWDPPPLTVLLESDALPNRLAETEDDAFYGSDGVTDFRASLTRLAALYPFLSDEIFYAYTPDPTLPVQTLLASYMLQYLTLRGTAGVRAFLADFSAAEARGEESGAASLLYLATRIDTDRFEDAAAPILEDLDASSFDALVPGFSADALRARTLVRLAMTEEGYASGARPLGSYTYWDFSTAGHAQNWYGGSGCSDLSIVTGYRTRALTAHCTPQAGSAYAELLYRFTEDKDLSFAPFLRLNLQVEGQTGADYEVLLCLVGRRDTVVSSSIVAEGEAVTLYLDLAAYSSRLTELSCMRICIRPLEESTDDFRLRLYDITLQSTTLSDRALADRILSLHATVTEEAPEAPARDYRLPILFTCLLAASALVPFAIFFARRFDWHRKRKPDKEKAEQGEGKDKDKKENEQEPKEEKKS